MNESDILDRLEDEARGEVEQREKEIRSLLQWQKRDAEQLLERLGESYAPWSMFHPTAMLETETAKLKAWRTILYRIEQLRRLAKVKNTHAS